MFSKRLFLFSFISVIYSHFDFFTICSVWVLFNSKIILLSSGLGLQRGKVMGGTSSINSMVYVRGNKADFDGWAALGNHGWSYKDVLPFFKKTENNLNIECLSRKYHSDSGEQSVSLYPYLDDPTAMLVEAFHEDGLPILDCNGAHQIGTLNTQSITKDGLRVSANNALIQPIRYKRKNLTVRVESEVFKILINNKNIAYGVKYRRNGKVYEAYAKKEVIISSGVINSPKLLMLSGIGPKEHLSQLNITVRKDLAVGQNLYDHVTVNGIFLAVNGSSTMVSQNEMLDEITKFKEMKSKNGPLSCCGATSAGAFIKTKPNLIAPDIEIQVNNANLSEYIRNISTADQLSIFPASYYTGVVVRAMNLVPESRGEILLNATDPEGPPVIYANYFGNPIDMEPIVRAFRRFITFEKTKAFISRGAYFIKEPIAPCSDYEWASDEYFECLLRAYTASANHQAGTCKMGPKWDTTAIVDPKLRVYGVSGLRVIDASIMPRVSRGNTCAPSMMIGERGVAFVIEKWLNKRL